MLYLHTQHLRPPPTTPRHTPTASILRAHSACARALTAMYASARRCSMCNKPSGRIKMAKRGARAQDEEMEGGRHVRVLYMAMAAVWGWRVGVKRSVGCRAGQWGGETGGAC